MDGLRSVSRDRRAEGGIGGKKRAVLTAALSERCKSYGEWFDKCPTDGWWGELIVGCKWRIIWRVIEKKLESLVRIFLPSANLPLYTSHE